jgi:hypothetical protein
MTPDTIESLRAQLAAKEEAHSVEMNAIQAEHEATLYLPGQYKCAKCGFELTKSILYVKSGGIGPDLSQPEPCPNDGEIMRRVTWQEASQSNYRFAKELLDKRDELESKVAALTQRAEAAEAQVVALRDSAVEALMIAKSVMLVWGDKFALGTCEDFARHEKQFLDAATTDHHTHLTTIDKAELAGLVADRDRLDAIKPGWKFECEPGAYGHPDRWYIYTSDWGRPIFEGRTLRDAIDAARNTPHFGAACKPR